MPSVHSETWQDQEDYIWNLFRANADTPGGKLYGIKAIERVSPPESEDLPAIGFQYTHTREDSVGQGVRHQLNTFDLTILVQLEWDATRSDMARATFEALQKYVNDRAGNGLLPLLRSDVTLGNTAVWCIAMNQDMRVGRSQTDESKMSGLYTAQIVAAGRLRYLT